MAPEVKSGFSLTKPYWTLAVTEQGLPLGLLAQQLWVRDEDEPPKAKERPIEEKESFKWLIGLDESSRGLPKGVEVVQVSERESDIYEYLVRPRPDNVQLLLRSYQSRSEVDEIRDVRSTLRTSPVRGKVEVEVRHTPDRPARVAIANFITNGSKFDHLENAPGYLQI